MQRIALTILLAVTFGILGGIAGNRLQSHDDAADRSQSVRDRVLDSATIKAAYLVRPPNIIKDPNTGELSGIFVDILNEIGRRAGLRVEWVEEVTWSTMIEGLNAGRYDIVGTGIWRNATRGKAADFTSPLFYSGVGAFVREDDHRFDDNLALLNDSNVKVAVIDGEMAEIIRDADFPSAQSISLTQVSDTSQLLLEVQSRKADVTFLASQIAARYLEKNPGKLRNIAGERPLRVFPESMVIKTGQEQFRAMLDAAIVELVNSNFVERTIRKHDTSPGSYYLVAQPYRPLR